MTVPNAILRTPVAYRVTVTTPTFGTRTSPRMVACTRHGLHDLWILAATGGRTGTATVEIVR